MNNLKSRFPLYSRLLKLYPSGYRAQYEHEILQTAADMLDGTPTKLSKLIIWIYLYIDLPANISTQQLLYIGGTMKDSRTPNYIKRNSIISGILLLPFFIAITANTLDKFVFGRTLLNSWVWQSPTLGIWILVLPMLALLIAGVSYIAFVIKNPAHKSSIKRLFDVAHSWPILLAGFIALGIILAIFFHDSVQCWVQSPTHLISHTAQTMQCSEQNSVNLDKLLERII